MIDVTTHTGASQWIVAYKKKYKKPPKHTQNKRFCQNEVNIEEIEDGWDVLFDI